METVHCGYSLSLYASNSDFVGLPTAIFDYSVNWHRLLVFVDQLGVPMSLQGTTLPELSQSLEMPLCLCVPPWQSLCKRQLERVLGDLGIHYSFWTDIIRIIMWTALRGSRHGRQRFDMSIELELATEEEVEVEDMDEGFIIGGHESDPDQALRGVSRSTIQKLEQESCFVRDGNQCCCICLEKLNGTGKVIEIPCSHLFHSRCIVEWLKRNDSCPGS